jgi:hypothetical protein
MSGRLIQSHALATKWLQNCNSGEGGPGHVLGTVALLREIVAESDILTAGSVSLQYHRSVRLLMFWAAVPCRAGFGALAVSRLCSINFTAKWSSRTSWANVGQWNGL